MERRGQLRTAFLISIALIAAVQLGLLWVSESAISSGTAPGLWALGGLMFVFFIGFNMLEATQPSLVSRLAPAHARGAALGVFNTLQSMGFFVGGALGGWLSRTHGPAGLFTACAIAAAVWLALVWPMRVPPARH